MNEIYKQVWRGDLTEPGFYWLDAGVIDSHELRRKMIEISESFEGFMIFSMTRFDQKLSTRFHLDGGPTPGNILVLGYEPSKIKSRLFLADHPCAANDLHVDPKTLVSQAMYGREHELLPYVSEIPQPEEGRSYILFVNNSAELGVMHKAEMVGCSWERYGVINDNEPRMVNSIMLVPNDDSCSRYTKEDQEEYIATDAHAQYALTEKTK